MNATGFIDRLSRIYGPAYGDPSGEIAGILIQNLRKFDGEVLARTADQIVMTRDRRTWPAPIEIVGACQAKQVELRPATPRVAKADQWSDDVCRLADRLVKGALGRQAAEGGWLEELWGFCREHRRLPHGVEVDKTCATAERVHRSHALTMAIVEDHSKWMGGMAIKEEAAKRLRLSLLRLGTKMEQMARERASDLLKTTFPSRQPNLTTS